LRQITGIAAPDDTFFTGLLVFHDHVLKLGGIVIAVEFGNYAEHTGNAVQRRGNIVVAKVNQDRGIIKLNRDIDGPQTS
jgi:hypothetical protein